MENNTRTTNFGSGRLVNPDQKFATHPDVLQEDIQKIDRDLEDMIWRIVERYALLKNGSPILSPRVIYAAIDGLFQEALARVVSGDTKGVEDLERELRKLLPVIVEASEKVTGNTSDRQ